MEYGRGDFANAEQINHEIRRRALVMAQEMKDSVDAQTEASRQVFEELLMRFAEHSKAA